ncbi:RNA-binding protein [Pontixanthobacter gangjinensis]|uniref:DUF448 domain-containing protein n=1 Tax=Pontixanthobacter gangjinensis TaxID=1028742 RepID=A0A6I4SPI4_9SPHN|nr:DUF448 domain-containing protein [Pontixanthobacter gangjinensis]MXO57735.1 DUF448 domain-containing protein [Pontixanthobacter gangjinensis]
MRTPHNEPVASDISETVSGRGHKASAPERRCILSGEITPRDSLIRLAISPAKDDGSHDVMPDALARAPGRGAWLGVTRAELEIALQKGKLRGALARAFKGTKLNVPDNLPDLIESALIRVMLDRLGLEMRAGRLILGSDRITEQARSGRVALLLHANDSSEDGRKKLDQSWRVGRETEGSGERGVTLPLDRAALSVALGRENVVHMALADDSSAERVQSVLARLMHFLRADVPLLQDGEAHDAPRQDAVTTN